jgi:hypothetical protein
MTPDLQPCDDAPPPSSGEPAVGVYVLPDPWRWGDTGPDDWAKGTLVTATIGLARVTVYAEDIPYDPGVYRYTVETRGAVPHNVTTTALAMALRRAHYIPTCPAPTPPEVLT